jgi:2-polyprenyl-6-hydroxyphenyl methylase/3-demethylubiquinone-9 3-methyltransferase
MQCKKITFSFGKNWDDFVRHRLNDDRIEEAKKSLKDFLGLRSLRGMTFLDIGCGSGLFSLAAHRMGAKKIVSFDLDPFSVACCGYLREKEGNPENWIVSSGSVLDESFLRSIQKADIVYSWGVLHHTGNMWQAIRNAAELVKPGGLFFIAIYNKVTGPFGSYSWLRLKRIYNESPSILKWFIEYSFISLIILKMLFTLKNPISEINNYKKNRGMSFRTDIKDSLGGYPYEFANDGEVFSFCKREFGFVLENMRTVNNLSLNEFLFRKPLAV